ncbi:autotransporter outer membrane beta-barrel domain-containing protein, partial [Campylobacter jejuni]|nr:autotransporter outer membrane beta-barrel domain-containing protein [Campylobacter jejuni]
MGIWGGNSGTISIENFNNAGTISGKSRNEKGVHFEGKNSAKVHIKTFHNKNTGTIESKDRQGVYFEGNVHVQTFENTGTITGGDGSSWSGGLYPAGGVVMSGGTIETFINKGTIKSTGTRNDPAGVKLNYATVKTFENTGLISGLNGVLTTQGTIETFKNSGTIESTSQGGGEAAIRIQTAYLDFSSITNFTNTGTIKSSSNGIMIESGNQIGTIINKGTIETKLNGISFFDWGGNPDNARLGKIILEPGSSIKAGNNGINIGHETTKNIKVDGI